MVHLPFYTFQIKSASLAVALPVALAVLTLIFAVTLVPSTVSTFSKLKAQSSTFVTSVTVSWQSCMSGAADSPWAMVSVLSPVESMAKVADCKIVASVVGTNRGPVVVQAYTCPFVGEVAEMYRERKYRGSSRPIRFVRASTLSSNSST